MAKDQTVYAPIIDARGADPEAIAKLNDAIARDRRDFQERVSGIVETHWHLRFQADPFVSSRMVLTHECGTSLADAVAALGTDEVETFVEGVHVPRAAWRMVRPKPGVVAEIRAVPGGPAVPLIGGLASWWGTTAFTIGTAAITWGQIAGVALTFALQAITTALFAPKSKSFDDDRNSDETYSISGARNELTPWEAVPIVMGTHRITPKMGAAPYTEVVGSEQYLRMVLVWGYGPLKLSDIRIGNTPISDFEGVEWEHDLSGSQTRLDLYPSAVKQEQIGVTLTDSSHVERTTEPDADEALLTITWPNGSYHIDSDGDANKTHTNIVVQYKASASSTWITANNTTYALKEFSPVLRGYRIRFPSRGQYDVRMIRDDDETDSNTQETVQWTNMKSVTWGNRFNAPGVAKSALRIKASDQLNSVIDRINALASRQVKVWNGSAWVTGYSSNPAAAYRDVVTGIANANPSTRVNDAKLGEWFEFCDAYGLTYEAYYTGQASVDERLTEIAAAGMAAPHRAAGEYSVVVDTYKTEVVQHFTPRNSWGFTGRIAYPEQPHALRVQFANRNRNYEADEIIVYDDGYNASNASKFEVMRPSGVTTYQAAHRLGRHFLASGRLRPEQFTFSCDFENLIAERGDLVRLTHDVPLLGQASGRIKAVSGFDLTLDDYVTFESGKEYSLRVRLADGSVSQQVVTASPGSTKTLTVTYPGGIVPGNLWMFGEQGEDSILCLVQSIEPGDDLTATLTCIPYNWQVYNSWNAIPQYDPVVSSPVSFAGTGPLSPQLLYVLSDERALPKGLDGVPVPMILVGLQPGELSAPNPLVSQTVGYRVGWRKTDATLYSFATFATDSEIRISGVEAGETYDMIFYALDFKGATSAALKVGGHLVAGLSEPPPPVSTFRVANINDNAYVEWTYPDIPGDVVGYEIRWHPTQGITDWSRMTRIATDVPRAARSYMVPSNTGSYAIKPFDADGYRSDTALYVSSNISDPAQTNVVLSFSEDASFAGTHDGTVAVSGRLQLDSQLMMDEITDMSAVTDMAGEVLSEGTYTFWAEQDLGAVYTCRVSWSLDVAADNRRNYVSDWEDMAAVSDISGGVGYGDEYDVEMQISYSRDDVASGMTWTDWQRFTAGDFTARHFRFRLVLTTTDPLISPSVDWFTVTIDAPDRTEKAVDVVSGAGTKTVTFDQAFMEPPSVFIAAQDMQTGDYFEMPSADKTASEFKITFKNSSGTAVSRTFDWQATGIGRKAA